MTRWPVLLLCMLGSLRASAAGLTPQQLTDEYVAAVRAAYPSATVVVLAPLKVQVKDEKGREGTAFLDNLYVEISRSSGATAHFDATS